MSFATLHKLVTYLQAGLGLFALTLGRELGPVTVGLVLLGFAASWFAEGALLERADYGRAWNVLVVAAFALQVVRGALGGPLLALGIEYAAFLQMSRLFYRRTAREHQHIAVLAFLHLIAATVLSTGLDYAVAFCGFVIVAPWMLALTHLRAEVEGNYGARSDGLGADVRRVLASKRVAGPGFLLGTSLLSIPLFAATAALFVLFPRVGMGFLTFGHERGQQVAGFGRNIELGGFGVIRDDPTVVLRVRVPSGEEDPPAQRTYRLRGTSFDQYDGRQWTRSSHVGERVPRMAERYALARWPDSRSDRRLTLVLDPLEEPVLFLPAGTIGLAIEPRVESGRETHRTLIRSEGLDVRTMDTDGLRLTYDAYVSDDPAEWMTEELGAEERAQYLTLPAGQERVVELARQVTGEVTRDATSAGRILQYLRDNGGFRYTLEQPDTSGRDPLAVFLFDAKAGHCEYFSTAMAVMLRAVGIPSRNVTGFVGGTYNPYGRYYSIRQGDAHSWVEAHIDGRWQTFDPTPPARHAAGPARDTLSPVRELMDALRVRWSRHVVDYDLRRQVAVFRRLASWFSWGREGVRRAVPRDGGDPATEAGADDRAGSIGGWLLGGAGASALLLIAWLCWRRRRRAPGDPRAAARSAAALYGQLDRALKRAGHPRPAATTPLEHLRELERRAFPAAPLVREVTQAYLDARFGGRAIDPSRLSHLGRRVRREVRTGLGAQAPR